MPNGAFVGIPYNHQAQLIFVLVLLLLIEIHQNKVVCSITKDKNQNATLQQTQECACK